LTFFWTKSCIPAMAADSEPLGSICDTDQPFCFATATTPWRASVDVGSELAKDTIPIVYFFVVAAAVVWLVLAVDPDDVLVDDAPLDDVLLLLEPQPATSTAITATARATPAVVRKYILDTTFSSPTRESCAPYPKHESGVKFGLLRSSVELKVASTSVRFADGPIDGGRN
jgi:hypothetical protein